MRLSKAKVAVSMEVAYLVGRLVLPILLGALAIEQVMQLEGRLAVRLLMGSFLQDKEHYSQGHIRPILPDAPEPDKDKHCLIGDKTAGESNI